MSLRYLFCSSRIYQSSIHLEESTAFKKMKVIKIHVTFYKYNEFNRLPDLNAITSKHKTKHPTQYETGIRVHY